MQWSACHGLLLYFPRLWEAGLPLQHCSSSCMGSGALPAGAGVVMVASTACLESFLGCLFLHTLPACFQHGVRSLSMDHCFYLWDCSQDMSVEDSGHWEGDRVEDRRSSAGTAAWVPALRTITPRAVPIGSWLAPGQGYYGSSHCQDSRDWAGAWANRACVQLQHLLALAVRFLVPWLSWGKVILKEQLLFTEILIPVLVLEMLGQQPLLPLGFCFPVFSLPISRHGHVPSPPPPIPGTVIHPVPSSPAGP